MTVPCELSHPNWSRSAGTSISSLLTLSEVKDISGEEGNFEVKVTQYPRYVDMDKCIACGICAEKCPKKVTNEYDAGLVKRKAAYVKYAQAVPLKYAHRS